MRARWITLCGLLGACSPAETSTAGPPAEHPGATEAAATAPAPVGPRRRPPPTEHSLDPGAEKANKEARKLWIRQKHRAAPASTPP